MSVLLVYCISKLQCYLKHFIQLFFNVDMSGLRDKRFELDFEGEATAAHMKTDILSLKLYNARSQTFFNH